MSSSQTHGRFPSPPPSRPMYPHQHSSEGSDRHGMKLPSMSYLLSRHDREQHSADHPPVYGSQQQSLPSYLNHPLHYSEMNPNAPVHHLYQTHAQPVLVPTHTRQQPLSPIQYEPPQAQRRQSKKISQRREDCSKEYEKVNQYPASMERPYHQQEPASHRAYDQERPQYGSQNQASPSIISPRDEAEHRSVPISNLLSKSQPNTQPAHIMPRYALVVRQQPESARACGFGERDRRVVDPPPILVLDIDEPHDRLETYVVHCTLWNPDLDEDDSSMPITTERRQQRRLMGTNIASPFYGKDENNIERCFFTFPDLSVRTPGTYSLRFTLVVLDCQNMKTLGYKAPVVAMVKSNPFQVFNAKDFRGMRASTALTKSLKAQGCLIPVKKGNSKANSSRARDEEEDDDDNIDDDVNDDDMDDDVDDERPVKKAKH